MNNRKNRGPEPVSPKGGRRGCLGPDGTYHTKWCNGEIWSQGIGTTVSQSVSNVTQIKRT